MFKSSWPSVFGLSYGPRLAITIGCSGVLALSGCAFWRSETVSPDSPPDVTDPDNPQSLKSPLSTGDLGSNKPGLTPTPSTQATPSTQTTPTLPIQPSPLSQQPLTETEVNAAGQAAKNQDQTTQTKGVAIDDPQVLKLAKATEKKGPIARQNTGETLLSNLLLSLKAEHWVQQKFVALPTPPETEDYRFKIANATVKEAVAIAEAKTKGLPSYIGVAYVTEVGQLATSGICKSNLPSQTAPGKPKFVSGQIVCAKGSTAIKLNE